MASYSYDETGQYYVRATALCWRNSGLNVPHVRLQFFLITFLTFILVPWTYYAVFRSGGTYFALGPNNFQRPDWRHVSQTEI